MDGLGESWARASLGARNVFKLKQNPTVSHGIDIAGVASLILAIPS
jgi:hypothetical protein